MSCSGSNVNYESSHFDLYIDTTSEALTRPNSHSLWSRPVFSTLIGRDPTMFCSDWSRWFIVLLYQPSYAIKNQLKPPEAPTWDFG